MVIHMNKNITIKIDENLHGCTIEHILKKNLGVSGGIIIRLKAKEDSITVNGEIRKLNERVFSGDKLCVCIQEGKSSDIIPVNMPLDILYEDEDIIAVNKPRLMPTHPTRRHLDDTLANGIMYYFRDMDFVFHSITRLDTNTSGIVLIAKNILAAQILSDEMKNKNIYKEYVAVINGIPKKGNGRICAPIRRMENGGILREVAPDGKEALTEYSVEKTKNGLSFVRLKPLTGRTHQLRVHMSYIGHPIYGDYMYGAAQEKEQTRLHCEKITFRHPFKDEKITVIAPLPSDITALIE